jgi:hypothetical protein
MKKIFRIENVWLILLVGVIIHNYWFGIHKEYYITQFICTLVFVSMCIGGYIFTKILEDE